MDRVPLKKIKEEEFDSLTFEGDIPVIVFFGARRCTVCREQMVVLEEIAHVYRDKINTYWVDVDKNKPLFYRFRLQGIPNILIFNEGEVKEKVRGLNSKEKLIEIINSVI